MRELYTIPTPNTRQKRAYARLMHLNPRMAAITRIWVPGSVRTQGYARKLLKAIIRDADATDTILQVNPLSDGTGLTTAQLIAWYQRYGFKALPGNITFTRQPQQPSGLQPPTSS